MMKFLYKMNQISYMKKLVILIIICIIMPWSLSYFVSNYITKDLLEQRAAKQSSNQLRIIELSLKGILEDVVYIANYIQFDTRVNQLLKNYQQIDPQSEDYQEDIALNYVDVSKSLVSLTDMLSPTYITILFDGDVYYTNYPRYEFTFNEDLVSYFETLRFYETKWIGLHPNYIQSAKEPYLISAIKNIQLNNKKKAELIISVNESHVRKLLESLKTENSDIIFLVDQQGQIYSSSESEQHGNILPFSLNNNDYNILQYHNKEHLVVTYPVSNTDWNLVSLVPYHETINSINNVTRITIIIQGAFLLLFLLGLIVLVRELTKPITRLNRVTKSVESGNLHTRTNLAGNNDLAQLGQSFDHMLDTIEIMIDQVRLQEEQKRQAELEMLQAQINPHFLFNTLNAIRLKIKLSGDQESAANIYSLSALLRMTINRNNAFIPLKDELTVVKHYVDLMNFRHKYNINLDINHDKCVEMLEVPRFFLQPIIENSLMHAYKQKNGLIRITAEQLDHHLILTIIDDGIGMTEDELSTLQKSIYTDQMIRNNQSKDSFTGIGIQNVYQRLHLIYGNLFKLKIDSKQSIGTSFTFMIPMKEE